MIKSVMQPSTTSLRYDLDQISYSNGIITLPDHFQKLAKDASDRIKAQVLGDRAHFLEEGDDISKKGVETEIANAALYCILDKRIPFDGMLQRWMSKLDSGRNYGRDHDNYYLKVFTECKGSYYGKWQATLFMRCRSDWKKWLRALPMEEYERERHKPGLPKKYWEEVLPHSLYNLFRWCGNGKHKFVCCTTRLGLLNNFKYSTDNLLALLNKYKVGYPAIGVHTDQILAIEDHIPSAAIYGFDKFKKLIPKLVR